MKVEIKAPFSQLCSKINLFNNNKLTDMQEWEKQSVKQAKVKLYPTLHKTAPVVHAINNIESVREAFSRASQRAHTKMLGSKEGKKILASADKYNMSYDKDNINWFYLIHQIENYEALLQQARAHNIMWDYNFYDPIGLKQEIEEDISRERAASREQRSDYLHSCM